MIGFEYWWALAPRVGGGLRGRRRRKAVISCGQWRQRHRSQQLCCSVGGGCHGDQRAGGDAGQSVLAGGGSTTIGRLMGNSLPCGGSSSSRSSSPRGGLLRYLWQHLTSRILHLTIRVMDDFVGESGSDWGWVIGEPTCLSAVNVGCGRRWKNDSRQPWPSKTDPALQINCKLKVWQKTWKYWVISLGVQYLVGPILLGWHRVQMVYIHMLNDLSVVDRFYITDYRETGNGKPKLVKLWILWIVTVGSETSLTEMIWSICTWNLCIFEGGFEVGAVNASYIMGHSIKLPMPLRFLQCLQRIR